MYFVNLTVYFLVVIIVLRGYKFAGFNNFHEDFMSKTSLTSLRGITTILLVFQFMSQEQAFIDTTQIQLFNKLGSLLVATYFFCLGYILIKDLELKPDFLHGFNKVQVSLEILAPLCVTVFMCEIYYLIAIITGFLIGILFARKDKVLLDFFKKKYWLKLILTVSVFAVFQALVILCRNQTVLLYLLQLPLTIAFLVMLYAIRRKVKISNSVTNFFGKYSLYTYVLSLIPIFVFRFLIYRNGKPYFELFNYNFAIYIATVLFSTVLMIILIDRIFNRKQKVNGEKESKRFRRIVKRVALSIAISLLITFLEGTIYYLTSPSLLFIGHASVKLRTSSGKVIYIDPYFPTKFNYSEPADYILVTHAHSDHNKVSLCTKNDNCQLITWKEALINKEYKIFDDGEVRIEAVPGGGRGSHIAAGNVGYIVTFDGISVYHAADCDFTEDKYYLKNKDIDYALYTVNDVYTMGPEEATEMADYIGSRVNIPIHGDDDNYPRQREEFDADGYMKLFINQLIFLNK